MSYNRGDEIEVIIDRDGLGDDQGVGHLPDQTMVIIVGAGGKTGCSIKARITAVEKTSLGASVVANASA